MDDRVDAFFNQTSDEVPHGNFHKVIALQRAPDLTWEELAPFVPDLSKGWFELAQLETADRIEFTHDYWTAKLPFQPQVQKMIDAFFASLQDIGIYVVQKIYEDPFESHMVFSRKGGKGFFHGQAGASEEEIAELQGFFPDHIIPEDYLAFLRIHNGFSKVNDTGVIRIENLQRTVDQFQDYLKNEGQIVTKKGELVDPLTLIPFYESFGMPVFQCFWSEWYPGQEMGNVYYSGFTHSISPVSRAGTVSEEMAFANFLDWLAFYIEEVEME